MIFLLRILCLKLKLFTVTSVFLTNLWGVLELFQDQVLSSMQQKLDDLCQQLNHAKDQSGDGSKVSDLQSAINEKFGSENVKFVECGCWLCDQHHQSSPAATQVCLCVCAYSLAFPWSVSIL